MKGSDQCTPMAELTAAEMTVSHGENQRSSKVEADGADGADGADVGGCVGGGPVCFTPYRISIEEVNTHKQ